MAKKKITFESAIEELENIIDELDGGNIPLNTLMDKYKKGMDLLNFCHDEIENAQKNITKIVSLNQNNEVIMEDFTEINEDDK